MDKDRRGPCPTMYTGHSLKRVMTCLGPKCNDHRCESLYSSPAEAMVKAGLFSDIPFRIPRGSSRSELSLTLLLHCCPVSCFPPS